MKKGRKKDQDTLADEIQKVLGLITDQLTMTWDDLFEVAVQWCRKNYEHHATVAQEHGVTPAALILTALLYVEHPLLVSPGRGFLYGFVRASAEILIAQLEERDLPEPVRVLSTGQKAPVSICG